MGDDLGVDATSQDVIQAGVCLQSWLRHLGVRNDAIRYGGSYTLEMIL